MTKLNDYLTIKEAAKLLGMSSVILGRWDNGRRLNAVCHPINNYRLHTRKQIDNISRIAGKK